MSEPIEQTVREFKKDLELSRGRFPDSMFDDVYKFLESANAEDSDLILNDRGTLRLIKVTKGC